MISAAQKKAKENFKKAIAYRKKTGCSLKEAFAHTYGKKVGAVKKAAPKKAAIKKAAPKKNAGFVKTVKLGTKKEVTYTKKSEVKPKKQPVKISGTKKIPSEYISLSGYEPTKEIVLGSVGKLKTIRNLIPEVKVRITRGKSTLVETIKQSSDISNIFKKFIGRDKIQTQEFFAVMYMNQANKVIGVYVHSMGSINATSADIRLILGGALRVGAISLIICHNHPSGNLKPSEADLKLTSQLIKAASYHNINVLDHIIITKDSYYSFLDNGNLR
jgi:DNA repair protein RadC